MDKDKTMLCENSLLLFIKLFHCCQYLPSESYTSRAVHYKKPENSAERNPKTQPEPEKKIRQPEIRTKPDTLQPETDPKPE